MFNYRGKTALVTGASSGMGEVFAHELAKRGMNLILVARSAQKLTALAAELSRAYGIQAQALPADLTQPAAATNLVAQVANLGWQIDLLVNNAGFSTYGKFEAIPAQDDLDSIQLNVLALVSLTQLVLPEILKRGEGGLINVGSIQSFFPVGSMAVYSSTKAFVLHFTESLWVAYRKSHPRVRIMALCPGATATGFFSRAQIGIGPGLLTSPQAVVSTALRAFDKGQLICVPGFFNKMLINFPRLLPRWLAARIINQSMESSLYRQE